MRTVWFCEQDEFCRRVLAKHWPGVPCYEDVRELTAENVEPVDVVCGGVPCQPVSLMGKGLGEADERWLWPDTIRIIGELRPRYALLENPPALLGRGLLGILGDLAEVGYDTEWAVVSAADVGAPHLRERVWVVAYPDGERAHRAGSRDEGRQEPPYRHRGAGAHLADAGRLGCRQGPGELGRLGSEERGWWGAEPDMGRVAHGVPARVDRLRSLGNSLVPQIAEWIGWRILEAEEAMNATEESAA